MGCRVHCALNAGLQKGKRNEKDNEKTDSGRDAPCCLSHERRLQAMKMTFDLPRGLIAAAMETGEFKTRADVVVRALETLVRLSNIAHLRSLRGAMPDFSLDLDTLRSRK